MCDLNLTIPETLPALNDHERYQGHQRLFMDRNLGTGMVQDTIGNMDVHIYQEWIHMI